MALVAAVKRQAYFVHFFLVEFWVFFCRIQFHFCLKDEEKNFLLRINFLQKLNWQRDKDKKTILTNMSCYSVAIGHLTRAITKKCCMTWPTLL